MTQLQLPFMQERAQKVLEVLVEPRADFYTLGGIASQTGFAESEVLAIMREHRDEVRSPLARYNGEVLYTHSARPRGWKEFLSEVWYFMGQGCDEFVTPEFYRV